MSHVLGGILMNLKLKIKILEKFGSQADFAQKLNIDETVISRIVRGRKDLPDDKKRLWAKVLHCNPDDIFNT